MWAPVLRHLSVSRTIYAVDLAGHGSAGPVEGVIRLDEIATDIIAALRRQGATRFDLAGISLGGMVAQHIAVQRPEAVTKLTLANSSAGQTDGGRQAILERADRSLSLDRREQASETVKRWFSDEFQKAYPKAIERVMACVAKIDRHTEYAWWRAIADHDLNDQLMRITSPTCVVTGQFDVSTPPQRARSLQGLVGENAHYAEIPGAGHMTALEAPAAVAAILEDELALSSTTRPRKY